MLVCVYGYILLLEIDIHICVSVCLFTYPIYAHNAGSLRKDRVPRSLCTPEVHSRGLPFHTPHVTDKEYVTAPSSLARGAPLYSPSPLSSHTGVLSSLLSTRKMDGLNASLSNNHEDIQNLLSINEVIISLYDSLPTKLHYIYVYIYIYNLHIHTCIIFIYTYIGPIPAYSFIKRRIRINDKSRV